ncbi:MAG: HAD family hydrolase [Bryobacteraceae bacterium]
MIHPGLAIILDMDGVIVNSNPVHRVAWDRFNAEYGLATTEAMHERMYGKRNDQIIRDFYGENLPEEEVWARSARKEALYRSLMAAGLERSLVPGIREFLGKLPGVPLGLGSNAEPANVDFLLDSAGLRPYFKAVVDGRQVDRPKPFPDIYLEVARLLGYRACDCVIFEDSLSGVTAARAAGARVVGVRTTHHELPDVDLEVDDFTNDLLWPWLASQKPGL